MEVLKFIIGFIMIVWLPIMIGGLLLIYHRYKKVEKLRGDR